MASEAKTEPKHDPVPPKPTFEIGDPVLMKHGDGPMMIAGEAYFLDMGDKIYEVVKVTWFDKNHVYHGDNILASFLRKA